MFDPTTGRWLMEDPIAFGAGDPNLYRYVENNPTNANDPFGLYATDALLLAENTRWEKFTADPARYKRAVLIFQGGEVMSLLGFYRYEFSWNPLHWEETSEYQQYEKGCMGLNRLRLNFNSGPFLIPGARAFATLEAAIDVQKEMIRTNNKKTRVVITAYQDSYLNEQLTPFLLPKSKTEYDLKKIQGIQSGLPGITARGNRTTFDFVTIHQNDDLTVRFYETMDYGKRLNPNLEVKHKKAIASPTEAGTIYIVTPIKDHPRAPLSPRGARVGGE
jgi:hypothetical protein